MSAGAKKSSVFRFGSTGGLFRRDSDSESSNSDSDVDVGQDGEDASSRDMSPDGHITSNPGTCEAENAQYLTIASPCGRVIRLKENKIRGIAHQLWPAATFFCKYLTQNQVEIEEKVLQTKFEACSVIELGAGIGLVGLFASVALRCPKVIVTDLQDAIGIMNENIALNYENIVGVHGGCGAECGDNIAVKEERGCEGGAAVEEVGRRADAMSRVVVAEPLDWFDRDAVRRVMSKLTSSSACGATAAATGTAPSSSSSSSQSSLVSAVTHPDRPTGPPVVLATDCVYFESLFEPLAMTLTELVNFGVDGAWEQGCVVLMCHVRRWKRDNKFFVMCRRTMNVEVVKEVVEMLPHEHTGVPQRSVTRIYKFSKKTPGGN